MGWHDLNSKEVLKNLSTSVNGLNETEVQKRFGEFGKNVIKSQRSKSPLMVLIGQFNSLLIYILIISAILSVIIGHTIDAVVILAIVLLNSMIGFFQEYKAESIIEKLKESLKYKVMVLRDGVQQEIDSMYLVPGDIMVLDSGNKILADARIIESEELQTSESVLTGESFPVDKTAKEISPETILADRKNMLYAGTTISKGKALAVVVETGMNTEFGKLAGLVGETKSDKVPLEKKVDGFSKLISVVVLIFVAIIFLIGVNTGIDKIQMFLVSVSLAIGVIPEGLPAIIAITLSIAVKQMYKSNTLVRKLPAAETLGRVTVICTDKTGTLTEEKLAVDKIYTNEMYSLNEINRKDKDMLQLFKIGVLCNNARDEEDNILGDPTEVCLIRAAKEFGLSKINATQNNRRIKEFAFDSERKMMSIVRERNGIKTSYVKGAPNFIIENSTKEFVDGRVKLLSIKRKQELMQVLEEMESSGYRVLGFGFRQIEKVTQKNAENCLTFCGFIGMIDPPREEVRLAIKEAMDAGIKIKIITGDSALTTKAIAHKIGLEGETITGAELDKIKDDDWDDIVKQKTIFARVTPQQKLKVVETLKKQNETVGVTGDGVNDILALKRADIGISMGIKGSDVARDSSDIILLDDNFASIIKAVKQGRRIFDNLKKSIKFLLSVNVANLFIIMVALFLKWPLPFLPLALLWMNLVTDSLPALALSVEKPDDGIMKRKPENESLLNKIWPVILFAGFINFVTVMVVFNLTINIYGLDIARTVALTASIFQAILISFSFKSDKFVLRKDIFDNKWLVYAGIFSILIQLIAIYTPLGSLFGFVPLNANQILWSFGAGFFGLIVLEIGKLIMNFAKR